MSDKRIVPKLRWLKKTYRPLEGLQFSVDVVNETSQPLENTELEMLLEVEKGVLYTWRMKLKPIPAEGSVPDAMESVYPHFHVYENVTFGKGTIYLRLFDSQGRLLAEDSDEITIVE